MESDHLVKLRIPRDCYKCSERTYWTTERRLKTAKGVCISHAGKLVERNQPMSFKEVMRNVLAYFPGSDIVDEQLVRKVDLSDYLATVKCHWILANRTYTQQIMLPSRHLGPCASCRRICHLYGPGGSPLCQDCQTARRLALTGGVSHVQ